MPEMTTFQSGKQAVPGPISSFRNFLSVSSCLGQSSSDFMLYSKTLPLFVQLSSLKEMADGLKKQLSREQSRGVQNKLKAMLQRRDKIKELSIKRREELELSRLLCIFNRDTAQVTSIKYTNRFHFCYCSKKLKTFSSNVKTLEKVCFVLHIHLYLCQAEEWVSERMQKMAEDNKADLSNLKTKMKLLQKHQVFEAEILAHSEIIRSVLLVRRDKVRSGDKA